MYIGHTYLPTNIVSPCGLRCGFRYLDRQVKSWPVSTGAILEPIS